jgi:hypothetical protein
VCEAKPLERSAADLYETLDRFAKGLALVAVAYRSMRTRELGVDQEMGLIESGLIVLDSVYEEIDVTELRLRASRPRSLHIP